METEELLDMFDDMAMDYGQEDTGVTKEEGSDQEGD